MKARSALLTTLLLLLLVLPFRGYGLTVEEEQKYGREMYLEIAKAVPLNNDVFISLYLRTLINRLNEVTRLDMPIFFSVIDSPSVDAFASIGGYVFITTGLVALTDSEEELAGVLAHEFAHISRRHVAKAMEKQKIASWGTLATLLAAAIVPGAAGKSAVMVSGLAGAQQVAITHTREAEEEADALGSTNADRAGYSALGTAEFLKKLTKTSDNRQIPRYLLTHPYPSERAVKIELEWKGSKVRVDTSFYPYLVARAQIVHGFPGLSTDEIWLNRYARDRDNPVAAYGAALVYTQKGDVDEAVRIASTMKSQYRNLFLAEMLVNARRFGEAITLLKNESNVVGVYFLGRAYEGSGNRQAAINTYKSIFKCGDSFPDIYKRIGMLSGMMGNEGQGYENLGRYYLLNGNVDQARISFEKAIVKYGVNTNEAREVMKLLDLMMAKKKK